jgi:hypothetical protein
MPIVVSREDVLKRGGKYLPPKPAPAPKPPPPPPPEPKVIVAPPDVTVSNRMASLMAAGSATSNEKLDQIAALLSRAGGSWDVEVTERDADGRISRMSFTKTT